MARNPRTGAAVEVQAATFRRFGRVRGSARRWVVPRAAVDRPKAPKGAKPGKATASWATGSQATATAAMIGAGEKAKARR